MLCMSADKASAKIIPRGAGDTRAPWFCFENYRFAMEKLQIPNKKPKGTCGYRLEATVQITDYVADRRESDVTDSYFIFTGIGRGWEKEDVVVEKSGRQIAELSCAGAAKSKIGPELFERANIPDDPDSEFDIP